MLLVHVNFFVVRWKRDWLKFNKKDILILGKGPADRLDILQYHKVNTLSVVVNNKRNFG